MSVEEDKAIVLRSVEDVWSKGKLNLVDDLWDVDFVRHDSSGEEICGRDGIRQVITAYRTGLPDLQFTSEDVIAEGDKVALRWSSVGSHNGQLIIPPTGKPTSSRGISILRMKGGKIAEEWVSWDELGWLRQLGVVPPVGEGER